MDNKTIGTVFALAGLFSFLYSFNMQTNQQVYFWTGVILFVGGLLYAKYAKK